MSKIYLKNLRLTNFATFKLQEIDFTQGLNALIGETGSGKSLILDALQFVLGSRADKRFIRKGSDFSILEASYQVSDTEIKTFFQDIGYPFNEDDNEVLIKRVLYKNGSSKCFLNYQSCTLQTLQNFSRRFIDLVGQFENQKLLNENYQIKLLDRYGALEKRSEQYQKDFTTLKDFQQQLQELIKDQTNRDQRVDFLKYQIQEIEALDPSKEREQELITQKDHLLKSKDAQKYLYQLKELMTEGESNIVGQIDQAQALLEEVKGFVSNDIPLRLEQIQADLSDLSYEISKTNLEEIEGSDIDQILEELDQYQKVKRKFGGSTEAAITKLDDYKKELNELDSLEKTIEKVQNTITEKEKIVHYQARELHETRKKTAKKLSKELTKRIQALNMQDAFVDIEITKNETLTKHGYDSISLQAQTNPGEGIHPIKEIASGGELSRILLALRQVLAFKDSISIFLFDEIDTGIGGETALTIGQALADVSKYSQVIAITHLPQIAHFSDQLIVVDKEVTQEKSESRTVSTIEHIEHSKVQRYAKEMAQLV